jgi:hydrogenase nickel incorporation protein HypA/HybF
MHELSIASSIVDHVLEYAETPPAKKVLKVIVRIGELSCIEPDQLIFSYRAITKETPLEGSELETEQTPARVMCRHCGYEGAPKYWDDARGASGVAIATLQCPKCSQSAEIAEGNDCVIKTIRYVER